MKLIQTPRLPSQVAYVNWKYTTKPNSKLVYITVIRTVFHIMFFSILPYIFPMHQILLKGYKIAARMRAAVTISMQINAVPKVRERYADSNARVAKPSIILLPSPSVSPNGLTQPMFSYASYSLSKVLRSFSVRESSNALFY